jgi:hypothetical protein
MNASDEREVKVAIAISNPHHEIDNGRQCVARFR